MEIYWKDRKDDMVGVAIPTAYTTLTEFYNKIQTLVERILVVLTNYERENE